jgi:hypothetical protein
MFLLSIVVQYFCMKTKRWNRHTLQRLLQQVLLRTLACSDGTPLGFGSGDFKRTSKSLNNPP